MIEKDEVALWDKRATASTALREEWEKEFRVAECYQYWKGRQREQPMDGSERKAVHNKVHPDVAEQIPSMYFYAPYGKVIAAPERSDTPRETINEKARLLQDTGLFLVRDKNSGFRENTFLALKESRWAIGCVEVGYSAEFIDNPTVEKPALKEKKETKIMSAPGRDELGLTVDEDSSQESLREEMVRLKANIKNETFFCKHIPGNHLIISPSNKPVLEDNDYVGYWEDYPLEDVRRSPAYKNTADLKAGEGQLAKNDTLGTPDMVRLYRIWDLRTRTKLVFAKGHDKFLYRKPFNRRALFFYRPDVDPYAFLPIPPIYHKLSSQDEYNDSREYLRKMRIGTVPRYTYDEDAVEADEAKKFQSREMHVMIPRKAGTRNPIEPVQQISTSGGAVQTLALAEREFQEAGRKTDQLSPATQTATRAVLANAKQSAEEGFDRNNFAEFLAEVIQELIQLAVDHMSLPKWIAVHVDLDSPLAMEAAAQVATLYQQIEAEKLRDATLGIRWHVEIEADSLSPVSEAERGMKIMQMVQFISNPQAAMLLVNCPTLLKRILRTAGITNGEDVDAVKEALQYITRMTLMTAQRSGAAPPGIAPAAGEETGPPQAAPMAPPEVPQPMNGGVVGA